MFAATIQHQPSSLVSRIGLVGTQVSGSGALACPITEDILPGEGIVLHVTCKALNTWSSMLGPTDVNGQRTISGQNTSDGTLGGFNVNGNLIPGSTGAHLVSFHSAGARIASGSNFTVTINTGGAVLFSIFRIRGNARLQNREIPGTSGTSGTIYNLGNISRQVGANINPGTFGSVGGSIGGYRRNMAFLSCSSTGTSALQDGVAANFSLLNGSTFPSGTQVGQSAQRWDLHYVPFNTAALYRQNGTTGFIATNMSFVI